MFFLLNVWIDFTDIWCIFTCAKCSLYFLSSLSLWLTQTAVSSHLTGALTASRSSPWGRTGPLEWQLCCAAGFCWPLCDDTRGALSNVCFGRCGYGGWSCVAWGNAGVFKSKWGRDGKGRWVVESAVLCNRSGTSRFPFAFIFLFFLCLFVPHPHLPASFSST